MNPNGRPKLRTEFARSERLQLMVTPARAADLRLQAKRWSLSVSDYLCKLLWGLRGRRKSKPTWQDKVRSQKRKEHKARLERIAAQKARALLHRALAPAK